MYWSSKMEHTFLDIQVFLEFKGLLCDMFIVQDAFHWEVHELAMFVLCLARYTTVQCSNGVCSHSIKLFRHLFEKRESNIQRNLKFPFVHSFLILFEKQIVNIFLYPYISFSGHKPKCCLLILFFLSIMFSHSTLH